ncbi:MAG: indole-3-glycerol phosphate synthase [Anaerolineaceae bacterium]|nr:MAG: indole-3-glycerol phosphate synthase [Anaerolineaceae bacterium]
MTILTDILARKQEEVKRERKSTPLQELELLAATMSPAPDFFAAINNKSKQVPRLIAEIKQRSPSKGVLCNDFNPTVLAKTYASNGASAISVLTDEHFFGGSLDQLQSISALDTGLPLLRKDFIFDRYQLLQARIAGASAALLIVAMLETEVLRELIAATEELGLNALVEVHNLRELETALSIGTQIIGINNRNLHTFETSLDVTAELRPHIPPETCIIAESGIHTLADVSRLTELEIDAMLIGEGLVTAPDVGSKVRELTQAD